MRTSQFTKSGQVVAALAALAVLATLPYTLSAQQRQEPAVEITEVPPATTGGPDAMFPIAGTVAGVDPKDYRICIYVMAGGTWFVQPFDYSPLTTIQSGGKWETETHGGSIYAALLVRAGYKAKAQLGALPQVGGDVVARVRVVGKR